jgi:hypothetical protein
MWSVYQCRGEWRRWKSREYCTEVSALLTSPSFGPVQFRLSNVHWKVVSKVRHSFFWLDVVTARKGARFNTGEELTRTSARSAFLGAHTPSFSMSLLWTAVYFLVSKGTLFKPALVSKTAQKTVARLLVLFHLLDLLEPGFSTDYVY